VVPEETTTGGNSSSRRSVRPHRHFVDRWLERGEVSNNEPQNGMNDKVILLVEDNPDDELLTLRALKKNNVLNKVVVARDGVEALDFLFATGRYAGRDESLMPQLVLLDLKLPKVDGLEVLKRMRANERTRLLPVVILTSSKEQQDMLDGYGFGANSYVRKPVNFEQFVGAVEQLKLYWLVLNEAPPQGA
jgi:two-component system response regulator